MKDIPSNTPPGFDEQKIHYRSNWLTGPSKLTKLTESSQKRIKALQEAVDKANQENHKT